MKANLDLKVTGIRGGNPSWEPNKGKVVAFPDTGGQYISIDAFEGIGETYKRRGECEIEIRANDFRMWKGTFNELCALLIGQPETITP